MEYIQELATRILQAAPNGLSKVKFAKIIYFTHKMLVAQAMRKSNELKFIRMPLGPVPVGFMALGDKNMHITKRANALSFDMQLYRFNGSDTYHDAMQTLIQTMVTQLDAFSTGELVEESHKEPSWIKYPNGYEYMLTKEDLSRPLPKRTSIASDTTLSDQHLQAKLMEGMLDDIVDESTLLEYPAQKAN